MIKGWIDQTGSQGIKIRAKECIPIELLLHEWPSLKIMLELPSSIDHEYLEHLKNLLNILLQ